MVCILLRHGITLWMLLPHQRLPNKHILQIFELLVKCLILKHHVLEISLLQLLLVPYLTILFTKSDYLMLELCEHLATCCLKIRLS